MALQVVRVWKGYGEAAGVDRYCREHFPRSVLPQLRAIHGFMGATVLTRAGRGETEVVVAPTWEACAQRCIKPKDRHRIECDRGCGFFVMRPLKTAEPIRPAVLWVASRRVGSAAGSDCARARFPRPRAADRS